jgi:hypothetical protein
MMNEERVHGVTLCKLSGFPYAFGPWTKQPGTIAYRFVLLKRPEHLTTMEGGDGPQWLVANEQWGSKEWSRGSYFKTFEEAVREFSYRLNNLLCCLDSMSRDIEPDEVIPWKLTCTGKRKE